MPSESELTNESKIPTELDLDDQPSPARKAPARKAAKKAAKKAAEKATSAGSGEDARAPAKDDSSDLRPTDLKGRGSHFDDVETVEVAPDGPSAKSSADDDSGAGESDAHGENRGSS